MKGKILVVHNFYRTQSPSGENNYVELEVRALKHAGYDVREFYVYSDDVERGPLLKKVFQVLQVPWNFSLRARLINALDNFKPDVVHLHNIFPFVSPAIYFHLKKHRVVTTLHNYRYFCAGDVLTRGGSPCTKCLSGSKLNSIKNRCYKDSYLATSIKLAMIYVLEILKPWRNRSNTFLAFSEFQKSLLQQCGIPEERLTVKPNFVPLVEVQNKDFKRPANSLSRRISFVGRMSNEKGVRELLANWIKIDSSFPGLVLQIIGDGPDLTDLETKYKSDSIRFFGAQNHDTCLQMISRSDCVIIPSVCFEGFPTTLLESYRAGVPVLVSNVGPLPELVGFGELGFIFDPHDHLSLENSLNSILRDYNSSLAKAARARSHFLHTLSERVNIERLHSIYFGSDNGGA